MPCMRADMIFKVFLPISSQGITARHVHFSKLLHIMVGQ